MTTNPAGVELLPGVYAAKIYSIADPTNQNRVQLYIPQLFGTSPVLIWAPPLIAPGTPPATVGDVVWCMFQGGDPAYPVWAPKVGVGMPAGGTTNQRLVKKSSANYDTMWQTPSSFGAIAATSFQANNGVVTKSAPIPGITVQSVQYTVILRVHGWYGFSGASSVNCDMDCADDVDGTSMIPNGFIAAMGAATTGWRYGFSYMASKVYSASQTNSIRLLINPHGGNCWIQGYIDWESRPGSWAPVTF